MSDVESMLGRGRVVLRKEGADLKAVAAALVLDGVPQDPEKIPAPAQVPMTDELAGALRVLPEVFAEIQPGTVRRLSDYELERLGVEQGAIDVILGVLGTRKEAVKEAIRNHLAVQADAEGMVSEGIELDAKSRPIVAQPGKPQTLPIPGTNRMWSLEYRKPKVEIDTKYLDHLHAIGEISREDYLALTVEKRVFDEDKAFRSMAARPGLLRIFRRIVSKGRSSTALFVRDQ